MTADRIKGAFFTGAPDNIPYVYGGGRLRQLSEQIEMFPEIITPDNFNRHSGDLADLNVIFSSWGMWPLSTEQLAAMPSLKALFYAAGATDDFAAPLLENNIVLCSAWQANAIPVAEFCTAQIILAMKGYFRNIREYINGDTLRRGTGPGCYGERVALLGGGAIAQRVLKMLEQYQLETIVVPSRKERRTVSMEEAFRSSLVVSNHLPNREDNLKVITGAHFLSMREGATFINTGRGAQVDEAGMITAMRERPDLTALLDVTYPEPVAEDSELRHLPNVYISGHIAGSYNDEVIRMADYMIAEFDRWQRDEPLLYRVDASMLMSR